MDPVDEQRRPAEQFHRTPRTRQRRARPCAVGSQHEVEHAERRDHRRPGESRRRSATSSRTSSRAAPSAGTTAGRPRQPARAPPTTHQRGSGCGVCTVVEASHSPSASPAKTKALQGNSVNVLRVGGGRRYHSIGSGTSAGHHHSRRSGVRTSTAAVTARGQCDTPAGRAAQAPQPARGDQRQPHDVQDVDLEHAVRRRSRTEDVGLHAEQQGQPEDLPAALLQGPAGVGQAMHRDACAHARPAARRVPPARGTVAPPSRRSP